MQSVLGGEDAAGIGAVGADGLPGARTGGELLGVVGVLHDGVRAGHPAVPSRRQPQAPRRGSRGRPRRVPRHSRSQLLRPPCPARLKSQISISPRSLGDCSVCPDDSSSFRLFFIPSVQVSIVSYRKKASISATSVHLSKLYLLPAG